MQRLIITADDYGMCDAVDMAIDEGIDNGIITTTNVMVNMETLHNAKNLRERHPMISVGMHWNVTTGKPVCPPDEIPSLVDENGVFWSINEFKKRFNKKLINEAELEKELEAQYALFESVCGKADYWNTHENSALHLKSFKVFERAAKKCGIYATRNFERVYYDKINLGFKRAFKEFIVKNFLAFWFFRIRKTFKMPTARVISFNKISKTEGDVLLNALREDGRDLIEVVVHPATVSDSPYFGNISEERVKEYKFTSSKEVYNKYIEQGFEFLNFQAL